MGYRRISRKLKELEIKTHSENKSQSTKV
jgi:hypothetical protein